MAKNPQWKKCGQCDGSGHPAHNIEIPCNECDGVGELIFCSICASYQRHDGTVAFVCGVCTGDAKSTVRATGVTLEAAIDGLREQWNAEHRRLSLEEVQPGLTVEYVAVQP